MLLRVEVAAFHPARLRIVADTRSTEWPYQCVMHAHLTDSSLWPCSSISRDEFAPNAPPGGR